MALAEKVGIILVIRVVAPQVSPQAVGQLPVTGTKPHCTEGPLFCKKGYQVHNKHRKIVPLQCSFVQSHIRGWLLVCIDALSVPCSEGSHGVCVEEESEPE